MQVSTDTFFSRLLQLKHDLFGVNKLYALPVVFSDTGVLSLYGVMVCFRRRRRPTPFFTYRQERPAELGSVFRTISDFCLRLPGQVSVFRVLATV